MKQSQNYLIILIFSGILIGIGLYFSEFHYSLSKESSKWADFGSYLAGISTLANMIVFVLLTITIQKANNSSKEQDRKHQKNLILTQLRYDEVKSLSSELDNPAHTELGTYQHLKFYNANSSLLAFMRSQGAIPNTKQ